MWAFISVYKLAFGFVCGNSGNSGKNVKRRATGTEYRSRFFSAIFVKRCIYTYTVSCCCCCCCNKKSFCCCCCWCGELCWRYETCSMFHIFTAAALTAALSKWNDTHPSAQRAEMCMSMQQANKAKDSTGILFARKRHCTKRANLNYPLAIFLPIYLLFCYCFYVVKFLLHATVCKTTTTINENKIAQKYCPEMTALNE